MKTLTPNTIAKPFGNYSHGVEIPTGQRLIKTSGQLAITPSGEIPESTFDQASLIFESIDAILREGGMSRRDIFHLSAYVTDRSDMQDYMAARDHYFADLTDYPASTLIIVSGFTRQEFKVEIEVSACAD